jgi:hypothetical protein
MGKNTETGKKRYVVAPGASFVGQKKTYSPGDPIDESAFKKLEHFKKMLSGDPPKIIEAPPKAAKDEKKGDTGDGGIDRKALEAIAVNNGLLKHDQLSAIDDEELKNILEGAGLLK